MQKAYSAGELAAICGGELHGSSSVSFTYVTTDSRKPGFPADTLFVALDGVARTGRSFLSAYYRLGGRIFLLSALPDNWQQQMPEATMVVVPKVLTALQQLAVHHRRQFSYPVAGITGSNGKTIVKEWLHQALESDTRVVRSPASYNSQIGVPLSVMLMDHTHDIGIFEAGISQPGEMQKLAGIIQPTIGIFTNLGSAHDDGFASREQKLQEKCLLFKDCDQVLARQQEVSSDGWPEYLLPKTKGWGNDDDCHFTISIAKELQTKTTRVDVKEKLPYTIWSFQLPFADEASVENGITTALTLRLLGYSTHAVQERITAIHPIAMRMTLLAGVYGCRIVNDSYSHDENGLALALNYWREQIQGKRTIIISDPGDKETPLEGLVQLLRQQNLYRLVVVGPKLHQLTDLENIAERLHRYTSTDQLLHDVNAIGFSHETILVKGARRFGLEQVVEMLTEERHSTVLEISLSAIRDNLNFFRNQLTAGVKTMVMLKAFGYGSGDAEIAKMLENSGVQYLAVAYPVEGIALRRSGIGLPIMVLNADEASFSQLVQWNLEPELYSSEVLGTFQQFAAQSGLTDYPVHIKLDTGMHRLGFLPQEAETLAQALMHSDTLRVKSVFTHFIAAESEAADAISREQIGKFLQMASVLEKALGYPFLRHMANSHGIIRFPEAHFELVRLGIGLYGGAAGARPALRLRTTVAQVKPVSKGETVGYGTKAIMPHDGRIAVLRIGYADGLPRSLGNGRWHMLVNGRMAPTIGHICMDMCMIDVTHVQPIAAGDEVEVFGPANSLANMAAAAETITYEIMTGVSQRVPRRYYQD